MLKRWRIRILLFMAVLGPGFITANVDNDSGGILTYSQAGAQYGYTLLWTIIPITIASSWCRRCAPHGRGHRQRSQRPHPREFGLRLTFILMVLLVVVITPMWSRSSSASPAPCTFFTSPNSSPCHSARSSSGTWSSKEVTKARKKYSSSLHWFILLHPSPVCSRSPVGTTRFWPLSSARQIGVERQGLYVHGHRRRRNHHRPWMQFYLQSSIVEKGIRVKDYAASRLDVIIGSLFTDIVAWFIIVACAATLYVHGMGAIQTAADAAEAMRPLAGDYAFILFAFGLFNASLFAASILPISTPTPFAKAWAWNPAWIKPSRKRRSSTGSIRC